MKLNPNLDVFGPDVPLWEKGQHGGRTRPMNRNVLFRNMREFTAVLDRLRIRWCLSHGTALGVRRGGDAIAWDDDADVALFSEDRPKFAEARRILREKGFYVVKEGDPSKPVCPRTNPPWYDFVAIRAGEKIEGWIFDRIGPFYIYDQKRDGLTIPAKHLETFSTILWRGVPFQAPADVDGYLTLMYGPGWRRPDPSKKYNNLRPTDFGK